MHAHVHVHAIMTGQTHVHAHLKFKFHKFYHFGMQSSVAQWIRYLTADPKVPVCALLETLILKCDYEELSQNIQWESVFACVPRRPMNCQGSSSSSSSSCSRERVEKHHEGGLWEQKCTNNFCSLTPQMGDRITSDPTSEAIGGRWRSYM